MDINLSRMGIERLHAYAYGETVRSQMPQFPSKTSSTESEIGLPTLPEAELRIICWPYAAITPRTDQQKKNDRLHHQVILGTAAAIALVSCICKNDFGWMAAAIMAWMSLEIDRFGSHKPGGINPYLMCWLWLIWAIVYQTVLGGKQELDWLTAAIFAPGLIPLMMALSTQRDLLAICLNGSTIYLVGPQGINRNYPNEGLDLVYIDAITLSRDKKHIILKKNARWKAYKGGHFQKDTDRIPLTSIPDKNSWTQIQNYIEHRAPNLKIDPEIANQFQANIRESSNTFTQLWLESMEAPGERIRMKQLQTGDRLRNGAITIVRQLTSGGQSCVYQASLEAKQIVVKEYALPSSIDLVARKRSLSAFSDEARLLSELSHPGIVKVRDHFVEDHRGYMVFDFLQGTSLRALVREQGKLEETAVRRLLPQLIDILAYLSGRTPPVVHRDFTPDNLILSDNGLVTLIDFTIAIPISEAPQDPAGKQAYMSIEQFKGKPLPASDLYSLGATLHFLLTGKDPEPISVSHPKSINSAVSAELDQIVAELTALSPHQRPSLERLARNLASEPESLPLEEHSGATL